MKSKGKIFKTIFNVLKGLFILFIILFILVVCLQRFSNNSISFFNYRLFSVATGSMQPVYNVGDVILCKKVKIETLRPGDDITYIGQEGSFKDKLITHRIVKIDEKDGKYFFHTKGVANVIEDPIVSQDDIYGKIVTKFKVLSWLYKLIKTRIGFYLCIFIPLMFLIGSEIVASLVENYAAKKVK